MSADVDTECQFPLCVVEDESASQVGEDELDLFEQAQDTSFPSEEVAIRVGVLPLSTLASTVEVWPGFRRLPISLAALFLHFFARGLPVAPYPCL